MTFSQEIIIALLKVVTPVVLLLAGGQYFFNRYELVKKRRELEIGLAGFVRERQYEALQEIYVLFGRFMSLYRIINSDLTDFANEEARTAIFKSVSNAEGAVDAAILRIGSEFTHDNVNELEKMLGNLRQSVQIWRESVHNGDTLPFTNSEQEDYVRFKSSFAEITAYLSSKIYGSLEPVKVKMDQANAILLGAFSNEHEWHGIRDQ